MLSNCLCPTAACLICTSVEGAAGALTKHQDILSSLYCTYKGAPLHRSFLRSSSIFPQRMSLNPHLQLAPLLHPRRWSLALKGPLAVQNMFPEAGYSDQAKGVLLERDPRDTVTGNFNSRLLHPHHFTRVKSSIPIKLRCK
jgi:hypothetical protein